MRAVAAFISLFAALGCAEPVDPWVGSYDVDITEDQWPCDTPSTAPSTSATTRTWMLERTGPETFQVPGLCTFSYAIATSARATLMPSTCDVTLDSGARATVAILDGTLNRDGEEIWGDQRLQVTFDDGTCVRVAADIAGARF